MATRKSKRYLETRIAILMDELAKLEDAEARWGKDEDYVNETVLMFECKFDNKMTYLFTALKIRNGLWYTTSQYDKIVTFEELTDKYLSKAESVYVATNWKEL